MPSEIKPFKIDVSQAEIDRLYQKIADTRYPTQEVVPGAGKDYGFETSWMLNLIDYWKTKYSWPKAQAALNTLNHYTVEIESINLHFIHQRSPNPNAIPILLLHGWPGSFHEFTHITPLLTHPSNPSHQSFHVIIPSLPGFTYTPAPPRGWTIKSTARILHTLLTTHLSYPTYAIQAGDWGHFIARELGAQYTPSCRVIHLNYCPATLPTPPLNPREASCQEKGNDWRTRHIGYASLMRTRPHSVGFMLQDHPVGILTFVGEKYEEAANPGVQARDAWRDGVLTTVCLYYFTGCIMSSALVYYENVWHEGFAEWAEGREENWIKCPFGYTSFWYDTAPNSKRAVERTGRLVQYKERDYAGHFACLEDPEGVAEDVRELVKGYWDEK